MLRILKIEAKVYEILWLHLQQHQRLLEGHKQTCSLTKKELKRVKKIGEQIVTKPAANYNLKATYKLVGLTPSKLQEGFKFLYNRTVNEYVRHIRLETAKDLLKKTDLNVSEVVYSVGFSNRSYFSKKFKEKYNVTPNIFKKQG
jgi:Transcriptional regulator containing an amidase domain and an AraC-type DNA-binding HTH domain